MVSREQTVSNTSESRELFAVGLQPSNPTDSSFPKKYFPAEQIQYLGCYYCSNVCCFVEEIKKQCTGIGAIKRQIPLLKPKRKINKYYK